MKYYIEKFNKLRSIQKIAIFWGLSAVVCLSSYYFARKWSLSNRAKSMKIRQNLNRRYGIDHMRELKDIENQTITNQSARK